VIPFATCQSGNRSEYIPIIGMPVQGPRCSGLTYADQPPFVVVCSLY